MRSARISAGGQISIPADVRRRWATQELVIEDFGDRLVIRPMPADPIRSARGALKTSPQISTAKVRQRVRREEARAEARKFDR